MRITIGISIAIAVAAIATPAHAGTIAGAGLTLQPGGSDGVGGGALELWVAHGWDDYYAGGELAAETYTAGDADASVSYHAILGGRHGIGRGAMIMADVGAGVSQQLDFHLAILGGESDTETEAVVPSGAVRATIVLPLGSIGETQIGITFGGDVRGTSEGDAGAGLGVGVVTWK